MQARPFCFTLLAAVSVAAAARAAGEQGAEHYLGVAYARDDGRVAYREEHWITRSPARQTRLVLYRCPGGEPFARKWVRGPAGDPAPDFDFYDRRDGYREGVQSSNGQRRVYVQANPAAALQSAPLPAEPNAVIDAGFDAYLRGHWDALARGQDGAIAFLLPSRRAYIALDVQGSDVDIDGQPGRRFRLSLDAWYGFAVPSIEAVYLAEGRRLRRFEGISNVRDRHGGMQNVRIEFPAGDRYAPPTQQEIDNAAALPLVSRCP